MSSSIEVKNLCDTQLDPRDEELRHLPFMKGTTDKIKIDGAYAKYVLIVLLLFNVLNYLDRQILAILAEDIKADLGISDAQLGFLFGTAFAVFYATFGMALGRLADVWNRKKLISYGLGFWSVMTALSGLTRSFLPLAACRFGVAVGESSAAPSAYSLLYDYFSPRLRTTALAIYSTGVAIGGGLGLFVGGLVLETWNGAWPDSALAPFGLEGWQAAFMVVGLPGLLMALWVATLREPVRGQSDGIVSEPHPHPFRETARVLSSMLPVANWWTLVQGNSGLKAVAVNAVAGIVIAIAAYGLISLTGDIAQWAAFGVGIYASISWAQGLACRDPVVFGMIFRCRTVVCIIAAQGAAIALLIGGIPFWAVPFFQRYYGVSAAEVGAVLGLGGPIVGIAGLLIGGVLADKLHGYTGRGKLYVWLGGAAAALFSAFYFLAIDHLTLAYAGLLSMLFLTSVAGAPFLATLNDLVLPRGRATTSAFGYMVATLVGFALGPFVIGHLSDAIAATGVGGGEALRRAMLWTLLLPLAGMIPAIMAVMFVKADEASRLSRARALGEPI